MRQGRPRLRDRAGRLLGRRGPGVRRHPADHQGPPRGHRRDLPRQGRLERSTPTSARSSCSRPSARIGDIARQLVAAGRAAETPVLMTRAGTTTDQTTVVSTLDRIAADARAARMSPPAVTVVGDVVDLRETLSWFETKPLFGWRVLVPRTKEQAGTLSAAAARLRRCARGGADHLGRAAAQPAADGQGRPRPGRGPLRVDRLHLGQRGQGGPREVRGVRPRRPRLLRPQDRRGRRQDRRRRSRPGACAPTWCPPASSPPPGCSRTGPSTTTLLDPINRVFLPRADIATENLVAGLIDLGWECDDVTAYRTVRAAPPPAPTRDAIKAGKFDAVVFTSSSTVRNLVGIAGKPHPSTVIAVIGPATAKTAEEHGLRVDVLAATPDVEVLVEALADFGAVAPAGDGRGRAAGREAVRAQARARRRKASGRGRDAGVAARRGVAGSVGPSSGRAGCAPRRPCAGWSPRPRVEAAAAGAAAVRPGGRSTSRARSRRCRASSSTPATSCARPPPRRPSWGSAG